MSKSERTKSEIKTLQRRLGRERREEQVEMEVVE